MTRNRLPPKPTCTVTAQLQSLDAQAAVNLLCDIRVIADDIEIATRANRQPNPVGPVNTAFATTAARMAIEHVYRLPVDAVTVEMLFDTITLTGLVSSNGDRLAVEMAITYLAGNYQVTNHIIVFDSCATAVESSRPTVQLPTEIRS